MGLPGLIDALSKPAAYPDAVDAVEVRQTHISLVFLAGLCAYKVKKPVALGFLDFSTLEQRLHFCEREVLLNRRLAPSVYVGVVPITDDEAGLRVEGRGRVIEWAVKMVRLPDAARFSERLGRGEVDAGYVETLAQRIAAFHAGAQAGPAIAASGRFAVVAGHARENFDQSAAHVGTTVSRVVFERLRHLTECALEEHKSMIESRAERGVPRDGHGDLRLDHVYLFPDRPPPADLIFIDCIEFNDRYRHADPVADVATLVVDLARRGRRDLAGAFADAYFRAAGDAEGRVLLPFYSAYRAAVRGKVEGIKISEAEVPEAERGAALIRARAHWLLALRLLEEPGRRPCLVLVGGLPGTGKSTLARGLAERAGFTVIRADLIRKELAGIDPGQDSASEFEEGIYTPAWTERTYAECLRRVESRLFEGERVLVDATFRRETDRRMFLETAERCGVDSLLLLCRAAPEVVRARIERRRADASDAEWSTYQQAARQWEEPGESTRRATRDIATDGNEAEALARALDELTNAGMLGARGQTETHSADTGQAHA